MVVTEPPPIVSLLTMASPIPLVPPVTKTRLPWNSFPSNRKRVLSSHH
jgi:hypothetical protein